MHQAGDRGPARALAATFVAMFCLVGIGLWGLPFDYDFMVQQFGWSRSQVTSGNAIGKLVIGPVFGFLAGWIVDRFGPRRMMIAGVLIGGIAVAGLGPDHESLWALLFLFIECPRICVRRSAPRSSLDFQLVRAISTQSDGNRILGHQLRRSRCAMDLEFSG